MNMHEMGYLIRFDPAEAKKRILEALRLEGVHKGNASTRLGCRHGTLIRWIEQLKLAPAIATMTARAVREGWHHGHVGGRPKERVKKDRPSRTRAKRVELRKTG